MSSTRRWILILACCSTVIALFMQVPQVLRMINPAWQGIPVHLNSDESLYLARVEQALIGDGAEQVAEGFTGDPEIVGLQSGLIERAYGVLFGWTGWRAATVLQIMDSVVPVLVFLGLWWFFLLAGFTRLQALFAALLFVGINAYGFNRPINQRASFLCGLLTMIAVLQGLRGRWVWSLIGGVLMGLLVGVYFWTWTFVWAWFGFLFLWMLMERYVLHQQSPVRWRWFILIGVVSVLAALPFFLQIYGWTLHPLYEVARFRSGLYYNRMVESIPYSIVFLLMVTGVLGASIRNPVLMRRHAPILAAVLAMFAVTHQQLLHGMTFLFVSHYIFFLVFAAMGAFVLSLTFRSRWLLFSLLGSSVYLAAITYDGRAILKLFHVRSSDFTEQHLVTLLPALDDLPRSVILSDPDASQFISGFTKHDILYSIYLKNSIMTHEDIAWRLCLSLAPLPGENRFIRDRIHLVYPDPSGLLKDPIIRLREEELVLQACQEVDSNPAYWLRRYHVRYVFWDEERQPLWDLRRLHTSLDLVAQGERWSLWKVKEQ
ncbi:MAG: hypothetical protein WCX61_03945 [Candidatus Peribacteraceae bacterium]